MEGFSSVSGCCKRQRLDGNMQSKCRPVGSQKEGEKAVEGLGTLPARQTLALILIKQYGK